MKSLKNGGTAAAAPAAAANNRGGLYHYGWENDESVVGDTAAGEYKVNALPSQWVHYHSARHAGCLYELAGFDYSADTYDHVYQARYFNGYFDFDWATNTAAVEGATYVPNWVHFFNAHLLVGGIISRSTVPPAGGYISTTAINANVVIANPQYEGLGFLNFIATYKVDGKATGEHYQEFIDMTKKTNGGATFDTYNAINTAANTQHTDGVGGEWFFDGWMGTWTFNILNADTTTWHSVYSETSAAAGSWTDDNFAISSFPHNELGKDFRFNLRILTKDSDPTNEIPESYYWYKVNTIEITFPHAVAYALHNDYKRLSSVTSTFTAVTGPITTDPVNTNAYQMMNVVNAEERVNIIPPLDIGTWDDVSFLRAEDWVRGSETNGLKYNRINGYLDTQVKGSVATAANWCNHATGDAADEDFCATKFKIEGLMNTYDEHFAAQKGNIQVIKSPNYKLTYFYERMKTVSVFNLKFSRKSGSSSHMPCEIQLSEIQMQRRRTMSILLSHTCTSTQLRSPQSLPLAPPITSTMVTLATNTASLRTTRVTVHTEVNHLRTHQPLTCNGFCSLSAPPLVESLFSLPDDCAPILPKLEYSRRKVFPI